MTVIAPSIENIKGSDGTAETVRAIVTDARAVSSTIIKVNSLVGFNTQVIGTTGALDANERLTIRPQVFFGHISGSDIEIDGYAPGYTDLGNEVGDIVIIKPTTAWADEIAALLEVAHDDDGSLKDSVPITTPVLINYDGWISPGETWTYVSASTFTVPGNQTAKYKRSTRLKFTQSATTKYLVVVSSSFGSGVTTVTIAVNTDYVLANAVITANYYSYDASPQGYPPYFNWLPTWTNLTVGSATQTARFSYTDGWVKFNLKIKLSGSTMGTAPRFTLPIAAQANFGDDEGYIISRDVRLLDFGNAQAVGNARMNPTSTTEVLLQAEIASGAYVQMTDITSGVPWTWDNSDAMFVIAGYPAV